MTICPECDSTDLTWSLTATNTSGVPDGRLAMHEVTPLLMLSCEECSETLVLTSNVDAVLAGAPFLVSGAPGTAKDATPHTLYRLAHADGPQTPAEPQTPAS